MKTSLTAAFVLSFADKAVVTIILVVVGIFLFWFLWWPSPEDDGPFYEQEDDDEDDDGNLVFVTHQTVFDKIVPRLICDNSPLSDLNRCDSDASITFKANETLREVTHFLQAVLEGAGYSNRYSISQLSQTAAFEITHPVGFELSIIQSAEKGMFILAFEYE